MAPATADIFSNAFDLLIGRDNRSAFLIVVKLSFCISIAIYWGFFGCHFSKERVFCVKCIS